MNSEVAEHVIESQDEAVQQLFEFLRIPSVSADSEFQPQMQRCAEFVLSAMQRAGLNFRNFSDRRPSDRLRGTYRVFRSANGIGLRTL